LVEELFQALVGAVLPDDDHYGNATLNSPASHAVHAITRVSNTQGDHQSDCTYRAPFAFQSSSSIIRVVLPNVLGERRVSQRPSQPNG
jgi:hypothetical protein